MILAVFKANRDLIETKVREPSIPIALKESGDDLTNINSVIEQANSDISRNNILIDNQATERLSLAAEIWRLIVSEGKAAYIAYQTAVRPIKLAIDGLEEGIQADSRKLQDVIQCIEDIERKITSIEPTVISINRLLTSFGFGGFKLE